MTVAADDRGTSNRAVAGRGEPLLCDEPRTLAELFVKAHEKHGRRDALKYKADGKWRSISSKGLIERAEAIAIGLHELGLRKGDRAAILAPNCPDWTIVDAGCQFAGIIDVPIYTTLSAASIRYIVDDSSAKVLFMDRESSWERLAGSFAHRGSLEHIVFFEGCSTEFRGAIALDELEKRGRTAARRLGPAFATKLKSAASSNDVATIIYTSGTTGEPKGVMLTHTNIISNVIDAGEKYTFSSADRPLSVLPLSHVFERSAMYLYILNGMAVHYAESIEKVPENLADAKPTIFVGVPRIFEKVYARAKLKAAQGGWLKEKLFDWAIGVAMEYARGKENGTISLLHKLKHLVADKLVFSKFREFFGGSLRSCITGGAALSDEIYLIFTGAGVPIMQGYGLTETSPVITSNNPEASRLGTVGRPIRNMQVRIAQDGEIEARGPSVMLGYYNKDDATRDAFTNDGWFRTGDIGTIDADGFLRITDRKKELFKTSGGKYIAPSPIEQLIRSSRFITQAVLIGNERKYASALIVPNFDMLDSYAKHKGIERMLPEEYCRDPRIIDLIKRQVASVTKDLAKFETVKRIALLDKELTVESGELTPTMKLKRRVIDRKYKEVIDELYFETETPNR